MSEGFSRLLSALGGSDISMNVRTLIGSILRWDEASELVESVSFISWLNEEDRARSTVPHGKPSVDHRGTGWIGNYECNGRSPMLWARFWGWDWPGL